MLNMRKNEFFIVFKSRRSILEIHVKNTVLENTVQCMYLMCIVKCICNTTRKTHFYHF